MLVVGTPLNAGATYSNHRQQNEAGSGCFECMVGRVDKRICRRRREDETGRKETGNLDNVSRCDS
jgi:hypothetical protein